MITTMALVSLSLAQATPSIQDFVQTNLHDVSFLMRKVRGDQRELVKINKDFGQVYRFDTTTTKYKEPFMLRSEANVEDTHILYIVNGTTQYIKIPRAKINSKSDLSDDPGRRQTSLDFGVLTPSLFNDLFQAKFVRWDRASGNAVFDLTYLPKYNYAAHFRIWLDPQKKYITKREWYNHRGNQIATFFNESPLQESGVWLPTKISVKNVDDKVAG